MFRLTLMAFFVVGFFFIAVTVMMPTIGSAVKDLRTDTQEDNKPCATGVGETSCTITLDNKSAFQPSTPNWTVLMTSPLSQDVTSNSVLSNNLQTVTISGLTASTPNYSFKVTYYKVNASVDQASYLDDVLKRYPFFIVMGGLLVVVLGVGKGFALYNN